VLDSVLGHHDVPHRELRVERAGDAGEHQAPGPVGQKLLRQGGGVDLSDAAHRQAYGVTVERAGVHLERSPVLAAALGQQRQQRGDLFGHRPHHGGGRVV